MTVGPEPISSAPRAVEGFLARWGVLLEGASEPTLVVRPGSVEPDYANAAARATFAERYEGILAAVLAPGTQQRLREEGVLRQTLTETEPPWAVTALALPARGPVQGVVITLTPPGPLDRPLPGTLRRLVDLSADALVGVDETGRIVFRNGRAREFFPKDILGQSADDTLQAAALTALRGGLPVPEETIDADGERRFLRWQALPLAGPPGTLPAVAMARDVTSREVAQARLQNRVKRLTAMHALNLALSSGAPLANLWGMAFSRLAEIVPLVTGALYQLTGDADDPTRARLVGLYTWERGEGRPLDEALALQDHPASEAVRLGAAWQTSTAGPLSLQWPRLRSLGRTGVAEVAALPLLEESRVVGVLWLGTGRPAGLSPEDLSAAEEVAGLLVNAMARQRLLDRIAGYTRELEARVQARTHELKSTQAQLVAAARLSSIGELSAGLAHELNQPLNVITGYLELLGEGDLEGEDARRAVEVMTRAADRMTGLVRHLRDFSRAGVETLRATDLRQVIDLARELSARATKTPVTVVWNRPADPVTVLGDPGRLEQLFINLIANAMQATESQGRATVVVSVTERDEGAVVEVQDQGPGVPPQLRQRIFEPFFTTKERGQGTGLGLSICARIADEHRGRIEVEDAPGGGALFRVTLPRYAGR